VGGARGCRQDGELARAGSTIPSVSVNCSRSISAMSARRAAQGRESTEYDLPPDALMLEINEGSSCGDGAPPLETMNAIRALASGFASAISALAYSSLRTARPYADKRIEDR